VVRAALHRRRHLNRDRGTAAVTIATLKACMTWRAASHPSGAMNAHLPVARPCSMCSRRGRALPQPALDTADAQPEVLGDLPVTVPQSSQLDHLLVIGRELWSASLTACLTMAPGSPSRAWPAPPLAMPSIRSS
jgi:hypothetical protein